MKIVSVKPLDNGRWGVFEFSSRRESLLHDLRAYGILVALYNLVWMVRHARRN